MFTRTKTVLATAAVLAAPIVTAVAIAPADAAVAGKYYSNCDSLHRDFKHGVARSAAAANKQVRDGYGRPATSRRAKSVYRTNQSRLDRDGDGTACEA